MHGWAFDSSCPSSLMWPPFSKISATKVAATGPNDKVNFSYLFSVKVKCKTPFWLRIKVILTVVGFFEFVYILRFARQFFQSWTESLNFQNKGHKIIEFLFVLQPSGPVTRKSTNSDQRQVQKSPEGRFSAKTAKRTTNRSILTGILCTATDPTPNNFNR